MTRKNTLGTRENNSRSKENLESLIEVPEQTEQILDELEHSNGKEIEATEPFLVIKVTSALFEIEFLKSLCTKKKTSENDIQSCCMLPEQDDEAVPIGFMPLTFDNLNKILTYNNKFKLMLFDGKEMEPLTANQIICLP